ncbi:flavodoxin domain-containing protein [Nocardia sp. NBC_01503]|uniref:flavodoxin domain-containing protein n=1 Tax=Nocardia sp. NBC_01503 TaxID=2975997 RepID=UPI002E7BF233|nr:flavodoxin domain-containing protein [Nocardia sp. NBC_01503]WTL29081.1 flavodoxin domain-containing protein [Nocardia sp. NBC_01503]
MTQEPVLVTYGSKRGGTAEIAQWIGDSLRGEQVAAVVKPAREVRSLSGYGAVVVGGALYSGRWHRDARRFTRHFTSQLQERPVWLFGSGPLDDSADEPGGENILGGNAVRKAANRVDARGYTIFGGRLARDARGFPASAMAKKRAGDYRDRGRIHAWAKSIAGEISRV